MDDKQEVESGIIIINGNIYKIALKNSKKMEKEK